MRQSKLRIWVFLLWVGFAFASTAVVLASPLRKDGQIVAGQTFEIVYAVAGMWVSPISLLAAFWFPKQERVSAREETVPSERAWGAIGLTVLYVLLFLALLAYALYIVDYSSTGNSGKEALTGQSVDERVAGIVKMGLALSAFFLAPINWLTGGVGARSAKRPETPARV